MWGAKWEVLLPVVVLGGIFSGYATLIGGFMIILGVALGYLMPPMGENLFLAAYRFDKSLVEVYRSTLPYVAILLAAVLLITYWPTASLGLVELLRR